MFTVRPLSLPFLLRSPVLSAVETPLYMCNRFRECNTSYTVVYRAHVVYAFL